MRKTILLLSLLCLECAPSCRAKEKKMGWWGETETQCMGRFCLDVPKSMSRTGGYNMQNVGLDEVPWSEPRQGAFERAWSERLQQISDLSRKRLFPGDIAGTIVERRTFHQGFYGIYYLPEIALEGRWTSLLDVGSSGLRLEGTELVEDKEELTNRIIQIGSAYRLRKPGEAWPVPGADYFYLDDGLVALPYHLGEGVQVLITGLGVELTVDTRAVAKPDKETLLDGVWKMFAVMTSAGESDIPAPAKHGSRTVAGMRGEELFLRVHGEGELVLLWRYPGEANSGHNPKVEIQMEVSLKADTVKESDEKEQRAKALWNHLLDSMRPAVEVR